MKRSIWLQILAILVFIVLAIIDAFSLYIPIVAIAGIILLLFKPKWLRTFINKIYE